MTAMLSGPLTERGAVTGERWSPPGRLMPLRRQPRPELVESGPMARRLAPRQALAGVSDSPLGIRAPRPGTSPYASACSLASSAGNAKEASATTSPPRLPGRLVGPAHLLDRVRPGLPLEAIADNVLQMLSTPPVNYSVDLGAQVDRVGLDGRPTGVSPHTCLRAGRSCVGRTRQRFTRRAAAVLSS